jgi:tRNA pseudouridine55 synthase
MITRATESPFKADYSAGETILIDKEPGWTSFDVVKKVRNLVRVKKVGHAGTLDPFATGLLILCTGKKTKEISGFQNLPKSYSGVICLGKKTETMDPEGETLEEKPFEHITERDIEMAREKFTGRIKQIPPMYSAKKHKGKALYKYARKGVEIKREPVEIEIMKFEIESIDLPYIKFNLDCSKGTYVRVVADDFGGELGCGAYLTELRRTAIGDFSVDEALTISRFEKFFNSSDSLLGNES